jgi:LPS-assembly lipoprotein
MSSREPTVAAAAVTRRCLVRLLGLGLVSVTAAACGSGGFQPLYGPSSAGGPGTAAKLAEVDIAPIPGRVGQRLRNELVFDASGTHAQRPNAPRQRFEIVLKESVLSSLVNSKGESFSQIYQVEANFRLIDTATQKVVFEGRSNGRAAFERYESPYANVRAREDAENRVAKSLADEIKTRLATYLSRDA